MNKRELKTIPLWHYLGVIAILDDFKWWDMTEDKLKEHIALFHKADVTIEELEEMMEV